LVEWIVLFATATNFCSLGHFIPPHLRVVV
jgi:hypothetical protein